MRWARGTRIAPISAVESDELAGHTGVGGGGQSLQASGGFRVEGLLVDELLDLFLVDGGRA